MLNVSFGNIQKINNNFVQPKRVATKGLQNDVFVRSTNTSFKGNQVTSTNDFITWANNNNFLTDLKQTLDTPENKLGSGFSHSAYTIPNCDGYILRTPNYFNANELDFSTAKLKDTEDKSLDINIGQTIAEIEVQRKGMNYPATIEVLKKQSGESIGVQPPETLCKNEWGTLKDGVLPYEAPERKEKYATTIDKVAQLPVNAYEELLKKYTKAVNAHYKFDYLNSNNLLVDSKNGAINLIDMDKNSTSQPPNYTDLLYALTNAEYFNTYVSPYPAPMSDEDKNKAIMDNLTIIQKFVEAMKSQGLKFDFNNAPFEFTTEFLTTLPCALYCRSTDTNAFQNKMEAMGIA